LKKLTNRFLKKKRKLSSSKTQIQSSWNKKKL